MSAVATETAQRLAGAFVALLSRDLDAVQMAEITRRNRTPEYQGGSCASHDFCDANMVMDEAFWAVVGRPADLHSDADSATWNAAWDLAHVILQRQDAAS